MEKLAEMMQVNKNTGKSNHLIVYDDKAVLTVDETKTKVTIYFNPENVRWDLISIAGCMVIDDIVFGFDLVDYFGDGYNVVTKIK